MFVGVPGVVRVAGVGSGCRAALDWPVVSAHMSPEFRRHGYQVIDWIADYHSRLEFAAGAVPGGAPGEVRGGLPAEPPITGEGFDGVLADLDSVIVPGLTHWRRPCLSAFFPASATGPSILGDLLASGLGVQGMLWATSPAATELETLMLDWLARLLGPAGRFPVGLGRRRRSPALGLGRGAGGPGGRPAPGQRRRHRGRRGG